MSWLKSALKLSLAVSFVAPSLAHSHGSTDPNYIHPIQMDGDMSGLEAAALQEHYEKFMLNLPKEPLAALKYIINKLNTAEGMPNGKNLYFELKIVDALPSGELSDLKPRFGADNKLYLDLILKQSLVSNPVYILETMASLQALLAGHNAYEITQHHKVTSHYHHYYFNHHGHYVQDPNKKMITNHYMTQVSLNALEALGVQKTFSDVSVAPLSWAELKINADKGSAYAANEMAVKELSSFRSAMNSYSKFQFLKDLPSEKRKEFVLQLAKERNLTVNSAQPEVTLAVEYFARRGEKLGKDVSAKGKLARLQYTKEKNILDDPKMKEIKNQLEDQNSKLNDLVKANDREGVAKLLEAFLPLEVMEPIERGLWTEWIEAIRRPLESKKMLLFRGLDRENDRPQVVTDQNKKEVGFGFFSTLLNRNQGNFTRRLRSVSTMRYRFQNISSEAKSPVEVTPSIASMMYNHSMNPVGSPMLSFTSDLNVARGFGGEYGMIATRIDSRRVLPNITSGFTHELELLVPLIVFPDEVVLFEKAKSRENSYTDNNGVKTVYQQVSIDMIELEKNLNAKLGHDYKEDIKPGSKELFARAYGVFAAGEILALGGQCGRIFLK